MFSLFSNLKVLKRTPRGLTISVDQTVFNLNFKYETKSIKLVYTLNKEKYKQIYKWSKISHGSNITSQLQIFQLDRLLRKEIVNIFLSDQFDNYSTVKVVQKKDQPNKKYYKDKYGDKWFFQN